MAPTYSFKRGEQEWTEMLTIAEMEKFLEENPEVDILPASPLIVSGVAGTGTKPDKGFRELLNHMNKKGKGRYKVNDHGG